MASVPVEPDLAEYLTGLRNPVWNDEMDLAAERAAERADAERAPALARMARVRDRVVSGTGGGPDVAVRIYWPSDEPGLPVTVYYHGGGFVVGSIDTHDNVTRLTAAEADTIVVSVDYRLAPEHPYPAAVDDAFAAYAWVLANAESLGADPGRVAVAGDSAGGFLAAVVTHMARERGVASPVFQMLLYPSTGAGPTRSAAELADAPRLAASDMSWFVKVFFGDAPQSDLPAYLRPAQVADLAGLPPAHVMTAELDPLRDDGALYVRRLSEAGVPARWYDCPGMVHGYLRYMHDVPSARAAIQPSLELLRSALHG